MASTCLRTPVATRCRPINSGTRPAPSGLCPTLPRLQPRLHPTRYSLSRPADPCRTSHPCGTHLKAHRQIQRLEPRSPILQPAETMTAASGGVSPHLEILSLRELFPQSSPMFPDREPALLPPPCLQPKTFPSKHPTSKLPGITFYSTEIPRGKRCSLMASVRSETSRPGSSNLRSMACPGFGARRTHSATRLKI